MFHATPLSAENPKGVKNTTRKVIKRPEGLGHLEVVDMDMSLPEEDEQLDEDGEDREVDKVLYALGKEAIPTGGPFDRLAFSAHHRIYGLSCLSCQVFSPRTIVLVLWMALALIVPANLLCFRFKGFARTYEKPLGFFDAGERTGA